MAVAPERQNKSHPIALTNASFNVNFPLALTGLVMNSQVPAKTKTSIAIMNFKINSDTSTAYHVL